MVKKKTLLNKLIRYDAVFIAIQYLSFALSGFPYMGVGRNMAYKKSLFFKNKGFASHFNVESGDDDLFINEVANSKNTRIEISNESHTRTIPKTTFKDWFWQKVRHNTTFKYYKPKHKSLLAGEVFSRIIFYCLFFLLITCYYRLFLLILLIFLIRYVVQIIVIKKLLNRFNENDLLLPLLMFDFVLPFINIIISITNIFIPKHNKWR